MEIEKNKELETVQKPTKSKQTKVDKENVETDTVQEVAATERRD